ncbi:MAG: patatin-like phospholipase family protein [Clostridia bacterium]|nr:patatin-like phospholipase family protein [Clostridia bacterium]
MSLGLALSGGGAKGGAHIGVLQALKEEGIKIDYISGASSGSIVAAMYACGYSPYDILHMFNCYCKNMSDYDRFLPFKIIGMVFTGRLKIKGLARGNNLENTICNFCKQRSVIDIKDIKMPIAIPTVDLNTGEVVYYLNKEIKERVSLNYLNSLYDDIPSYMYKGDIASIVRASSSFPTVFEPKILDNRILIDGGVRVNTPVNILKKMGAEKVIAVSFDGIKKDTTVHCNIIDVAMKTFDIMGHEINRSELESADYIIRPKIKNMMLLECNKCDYSATQGYNETKKNIDEIKKMISNW